MKRNTTQVLTTLVMLACCSCGDFLDVKPDARLTIPSSLDDLQALMDYGGLFTTIPNAGAISGEEFYVTDQDLSSLTSEWHRRIYMWEKEGLFSNESIDWNVVSQAVYYCNTVLEHLEGMTRDNRTATKFDNIKGSAKYYRAAALFHASLIWAPAYDELKAQGLLGMPLRTTTDFNIPSVRANLYDTFQFIIGDLKESIGLLPETATHVVRASKSSAYALLARVYLYMGNYEDAMLYADLCLAIKDVLLDYNTLDGTVQYPIPAYNEEVIFHYEMDAGQIMNLSRGKVNQDLVELFDDADLRKQLFFQANPDGTYGFRGRYSGWVALFGGLATDEMYLIRAECNARQGNWYEALTDLNTLLTARYEVREGVSLYNPIVPTSADETLHLVLTERRKELMFRGLRWYDVKRLNIGGAEISLTRVINGDTRILPPHDPRYALPLPEDIIALSGMPQNPR
ncbi:SusD family protein [Parapedobacter composti]|uniref:SusD family protein n=1 Tax=Parapedobacter composti TaxID=623281 RepID=A0A1I1ME37_9SPHI|nr:RagB/SusD family nutrient uptake outer membrane protein [Parapedobacter composti]SFC83072.1 SusD family protein [Parapedobacter composti]